MNGHEYREGSDGLMDRNIGKGVMDEWTGI